MAIKRVFLNGQVVTMNPKASDATAFAVLGDRFCAVGFDDEIRKWADNQTEIVDLAGKTVVPGFIESHSHPSSYATNLLQVDCRPESHKCIADVADAIGHIADESEAGQWVRGWGYDDTLISDKRHLTRQDLDRTSPEHPVFIRHVSGHLGYTNSKGLEIATVNRNTPQPEGGEIHRDEHGDPSGLLLEPGAMSLVAQHIPAFTVDEFKKVIPETMRYYNRHGITSTHDAAIGYSGDTLEVFKSYSDLETTGQLSLRVYMTVLFNAFDRLIDLGLGTGFGSDFLKIGCVKLFQDGSIQGITAALQEGYHNRPDYTGNFIMPQERLEQLVDKYHRQGLQIAIHANGDRAIESVLQALEKAQQAFPRRDHRHMIIHCQTASDDQIRRIKTVGAIPSYFVNHVYYWGDRHRDIFLGPERAGRIDPLGSSLKQGLKFSLHSDLPVTPVDPIFSMHTAVNRLTRSGQVLGPEERIPVMEALQTYTTHAAWCSFEEGVKGAIATGMLADFTVLSENPLTVDPLKIKDIEVTATTVGGRLAYGSL
jgi:predicted amidohydrolase YtcJ